MLKWLSEGSDLFRKIHILVRGHIIYDGFALIWHATLRIAPQYNVMIFTGDQTLEYVHNFKHG